MVMDARKLEEQIRKTGFVLENEVAQTLKSAGWTVISNKYYVDDFEETVREIDLVAYQVSKVQHFSVYTVLVLSCKKSESNAWALLAREANLRDPNSDWWPLHAWSNDKALTFQLSVPGAARQYHDNAITLGVADALAEPAVEVFAFQEMDRTSGAPQNDRPIFSSVTSLMKAQAYELGALPLRKKAPSVYQFNLLSVVDADLARLMFKGSTIECTAVDSEHYLARYIVKKKETFSRIRFIRSTALTRALPDYVRLHAANVKIFDEACNQFYDGIVKDYDRWRILRDDFENKVSVHLELSLERAFKKTVKKPRYWFHWDETNSRLEIQLDLDSELVQFLNTDAQLKRRVANALMSIYRYTGQFEFAVDEVPF